MIEGDVLHFNDRGGPQHSIDFITAHDGFTLLDLVSYNQKRNEQPWPFGPSDGGSGENLSWDCDGNLEIRRQQVRNLWTLLMLSRGVPMVTAGDELGRTQNGNNNPWCIDSVATWTNYHMISSPAPNRLPTEGGGAYDDNFGLSDGDSIRNPLFCFVRYVTRLRSRCLQVERHSRASGDASGSQHARYRFTREDGNSPVNDGHRCVMIKLDHPENLEESLLLLVNCWTSPVCFVVPALESRHAWYRIVDTAVWAESSSNYWELKDAEIIKNPYWVHPHSLVVLAQSLAR
jgi:glycogen operon protein